MEDVLDEIVSSEDLQVTFKLLCYNIRESFIMSVMVFVRVYCLEVRESFPRAATPRDCDTQGTI